LVLEEDFSDRGRLLLSSAVGDIQAAKWNVRFAHLLYSITPARVFSKSLNRKLLALFLQAFPKIDLI
jgi:hypothetical protein